MELINKNKAIDQIYRNILRLNPGSPFFLIRLYYLLELLYEIAHRDGLSHIDAKNSNQIMNN